MVRPRDGSDEVEETDNKKGFSNVCKTFWHNFILFRFFRGVIRHSVGCLGLTDRQIDTVDRTDRREIHTDTAHLIEKTNMEQNELRFYRTTSNQKQPFEFTRCVSRLSLAVNAARGSAARDSLSAVL